MTTDSFRHRKRTLYLIIGILGVFLALLVVGASFGSGFEPGSSDVYWAWILGLFLAAVIAAFCLLLWRNPHALVVDDQGIFIPMTFKRPLRWDEIHRIRRVRSKRGIYSPTDWLIVDLSPGLLAPLRVTTWRRLELWLQKQQGVRIPLHGLEGDPEDVVLSIERFRPIVPDGE